MSVVVDGAATRTKVLNYVYCGGNCYPHLHYCRHTSSRLTPHFHRQNKIAAVAKDFGHFVGNGRIAAAATSVASWCIPSPAVSFPIYCCILSPLLFHCSHHYCYYNLSGYAPCCCYGNCCCLFHFRLSMVSCYRCAFHHFDSKL